MASIEKRLRGYICDEREKNWTKEFALREILSHKTKQVIDHPDQSITTEKLANESVTTEKLDSEILNKFEALHEEIGNVSSSVIAETQARKLADEKKADKTTTLAGYGITDVYTKNEIDEKREQLINNINNQFYDVGMEFTEKLSEKADKATVKALQTENVMKKSGYGLARVENYFTYATDHIKSQYKLLIKPEPLANGAPDLTCITEIAIPTNVSELKNDEGYLTEHQDISGKADKATTLAGYGITDAYTKDETDSLIGDIETALDNIITKYGLGGDTV